ncbi:hypothetical protein M5K25_025701 [Dendrobium thyrsiflorum]|uniref:Uncharacterized protein n=1 Tax=Dendrobium thyrsiflorum TaxID=117978 RepID=A0ABD0U4Q0_DENTH
MSSLDGPTKLWRQAVVRQNSDVRRWSGRTSGLRWWSSRTPALGDGPAERRASSGGPAEFQALVDGPTEVRRQSTVRQNSGVRRWSNGASGLKWWSASGGGPTERRASGTWWSGRMSGLRWSRRSKETRAISDLSLGSLGLGVPFQEERGALFIDFLEWHGL